MRFIRAAVSAQFHKNGHFEPLLWNSVIVTMRISVGARTNGGCKVFGRFCPKTLHLPRLRFDATVEIRIATMAEIHKNGPLIRFYGFARLPPRE